jgi:mannose-1-phosphate guanylyltransferase / mannose-6-phosphate isomerase
MFCFTAGALLDAFAELQPALLEAARECWRVSVARPGLDARIVEIDAASFGALEDISIDYAVMESGRQRRRGAGELRLERHRLVERDPGESSSATRTATPSGRGVLVDVTNSFVQSEGRMVAAVGIENTW